MLNKHFHRHVASLDFSECNTCSTCSQSSECLQQSPTLFSAANKASQLQVRDCLTSHILLGIHVCTLHYACMRDSTR